MELIHTSPNKIEKINCDGLFFDCLFFSIDEYGMGDYKFVYSIKIDEDKVINVGQLYDEEILQDIMNVIECDEDEAEKLLDDRQQADNGDDSWWLQAKQGECAKKMGYEVCRSIDEQGTVYIIPMLGRESELNLIKEY